MTDKGIRRIKRTMWWTDLGFLGYWIATVAGWLTVGDDRFLQQWNWSFVGLDLAAIGLGLLSLALGRRRPQQATTLMIISLALTSAAGLMAINFYAIRCEFELAWWLPNLWLFAFPIVALVHLLRRSINSGPQPLPT